MKQSKPNYWGTLLQHPNNPDIFLLALSNTISKECKDAHTYEKVAIHRLNCWAVGDKNGKIIGELPDKMTKLINEAILEHINYQNLGIVHPDYVSVSELGFHDKRIETYQFTPIRKSDAAHYEFNKDMLVFGSCEKIKLPVVKVPNHHQIDAYSKGIDVEWIIRDNSESFKQHIDSNLERFPDCDAGYHYRTYMQQIDYEYPEGYIVLAESDPKQEYDITMKNAKAVLVKSIRKPVTTLNHNISRLIYKSPVLVIHQYSSILNKFKTGDMVNFSCNGTNFKLDKA